jgi:hypothetical protein
MKYEIRLIQSDKSLHEHEKVEKSKGMNRPRNAEPVGTAGLQK